jgi:hypothetical protein
MKVSAGQLMAFVKDVETLTGEVERTLKAIPVEDLSSERSRLNPVIQALNRMQRLSQEFMRAELTLRG